MKTIFSAAWLFICLLMTVYTDGVMASSIQDNPATHRPAATPNAPVQDKKAVAVKKKAPPAKRRASTASKSKSASEVAKTRLPPAKLDLSLPPEMVKQLQPIGTVPLSRHDTAFPQMFGDKTGSSPFQLNGRLLSNEMQLQLRNEERRDVEGAALDFEFKQ
ncbi:MULTISPECIES: translation initiation factor 2 [unclassified Pseudomonas]|uniref:translation initiation factor 2 n=1 Tax=unclassified Pseudomonas TaxID=196821 RepID=UPI002AC9A495|nr:MULTISPECIES: translation initiation factor 2 [unclassified Pseudomonas]MEB0047690.1 translation initiation factor 2 [Pseudomonas sp. Dout3]MEB0098687.1 translation initiation factor 2 [Pseudomonas sp. DC1.2]WPX57441.1 translation initiation factor 2 [Pseudomonas sp. DC1.2]